MKQILFLLLLLLSLSAWSQEKAETEENGHETISEDSEQQGFSSEKLGAIQLIKENLTNLKRQIQLKEKMVAEAIDPATKATEDADLQKIKKRYERTKLKLITAITNIKLEQDDRPKDDKKRDLMQEAQQLIGPALDSIHRISAKPRRIESIKNRIAHHEEQLGLIDQALKNLDIVKASPDFQQILPEIAPYINDAIENITDKKQEHQLKIDSLNARLADLTKDKKSLWDVLKDGTKDFLSTRGKNLALSIFVFFLIFWPMVKFREKVLWRWLSVHPDDWYVKPVKAFYGLFTFALSFALSLFTLSALGDWVLVTLTILGITALLWASKAYLPKYLTEFKLILNFGTIKEGELVVYEGLPWKVKNIGFQTVFENEFLDSKQIRIQISEIIRMHSRKILPQEQWFPSRTLDWVLLNDGNYGQVVSQTLEQVVLELGSMARKYYRTQDYLALAPINMSHGFKLESSWSLDYSQQSTLNSKLLPKLKAALEEKLAPYEAQDVSISFYNAGPHSLDLWVSAKFKGELAYNRLQIIRDIQSFMLEITNENKLIIPFNQIVVHQALS